MPVSSATEIRCRYLVVVDLTTALHTYAKRLLSLTAKRQSVFDIPASLTAALKEMTIIFANRTSIEALEFTENTQEDKHRAPSQYCSSALVVTSIETTPLLPVGSPANTLLLVATAPTSPEKYQHLQILPSQGHSYATAHTAQL
jgi:hypothetical protein